MFADMWDVEEVAFLMIILLLIQEIVFDDDDLVDIDQVVTFLCN